jgi:hypothetical protein
MVCPVADGSGINAKLFLFIGEAPCHLRRATRINVFTGRMTHGSGI